MSKVNAAIVYGKIVTELCRDDAVRLANLWLPTKAQELLDANLLYTVVADEIEGVCYGAGISIDAEDLQNIRFTVLELLVTKDKQAFHDWRGAVREGCKEVGGMVLLDNP